MDRERDRKVEELFFAAIDSQGSQRASVLTEACGDDADLRAEVEALLDADDSGASILDTPACNLALGIIHRNRAQRTIAHGERIGSYRITRLIASGGMGVVYEAEQDRPRRTVALKLLQGALASPQRLRRFVTEAEILAQLNHPNIAQVFEAGTGDDASDGTPYMALELIPEAASITQFVRERRLDFPSRLNLFLQVCDAIHYVHQRGVIHRDLKPPNVLVDAAGRPRVIDFGVARLVEGDGEAATRLTGARQLLGTLPYMSPEQIRGDVAQVDTRSDVYALGVMLFEILTGRAPYDLRSDNLPDAIRAIESAEPPRLASVDRTLRGDLETIVHKALEKQADRRYQSVEALADDLRCFLDGRPISARPPTLTYQLRTAVGRRPGVSALAALLLVSLVGFSVAMTVLYTRAEDDRLRAVSAEQRAEKEAERAEEETERAQTEAEKARQVAASMTKLLSRLKNQEETSDSFTSTEVLELASETIREQLQHQPDAQAQLMMALGNIYNSLDRYDKGIPLMRSALELYRREFSNDDPTVAEGLQPVALALYLNALNQLATTLTARGEIEEPSQILFEALDSCAASGRLDEPQVHALARHLVNAFRVDHHPVRAERLCRNVIARYRKGLDAGHTYVGDMLGRLGMQLFVQGRYTEAQGALDEALQILERSSKDDHTIVVRCLTTMGRLALAQGELALAERLLRRALAMADQHGRSIDLPLNLLVRTALARGDREEAESLSDEWLAPFRAHSDERAGALVTGLEALVRRHSFEANYDFAERLCREALTVCEEQFGHRHERVALVWYRLGNVLFARGDFAAAEEAYRRQADILIAMPPKSRPRGINAYHGLAHALYARGDKDALKQLLPAVTEEFEVASNETHKWRTSGVRLHLGELLTFTGDAQAAEPLLRECVELRAGILGDENYLTQYARGALGECLVELGRFEQAEPLVVNSYRAIRAVQGLGSMNTRVAQHRVTRLYEAWQRPDQAEHWRTRLFVNEPSGVTP